MSCSDNSIAKCLSDIDKLWKFRLDQKLESLRKDFESIKETQINMGRKIDSLENANPAALAKIDHLERIVIPDLNRDITKLLTHYEQFAKLIREQQVEIGITSEAFSLKHHVCQDPLNMPDPGMPDIHDSL